VGHAGRDHGGGHSQAACRVVLPDWLLERPRRAKRASLTSVAGTRYLLGVSTRRMEKLVETLGITRL
jgi:hypothetical protein